MSGALQLTVASLGGDRHRVTVRGHELVVDQPRGDGGEDAGPTPVELFVASLATCVAHYARRGLGRDGEGPRVDCRWVMSDAPPWRVTQVEIDVQLPSGTSPGRMESVRRAVAHCTVHNSLKSPPTVVIATTTASPRRDRAPALAAAAS